MSLLDEQMERVVKLTRVSAKDKNGGTETKGWQSGEIFLAAIVLDASRESESANQKHTKNQYIVITKTGALLRYHDVIRRESDGKIFRMTSDGIQKTPRSATMALRRATAEEWSLA